RARAAHRRAPAPRRHVAAGGDRAGGAAGRAGVAAPAPRARAGGRGRRAADDPVAGAAGAADPAVRDRRAARAGGAVPVRLAGRRNTRGGRGGTPEPLRESARALGLTPGAQLRLVELPLAMPAIVAGVKTAAVINIGTATVGALIGAGGYGQPILTGIRLNDFGLILQGAVPAALMAMGAERLFEAIERRVVPRPLRRPA